jgi:outer membrane protein assembly factor BamE (lipoprotein component of BamABCDE complex)
MFPWPMFPRFRHLSTAVAVTAMLAAAGCSPEVNQRGDLPSPERVAEIHPGLTKEQVVKILGTPSSMGVFDDNSWYYISRKTSRISFLEPDVLDQQVLAINFDNNGIVRDMGHRTLADARDIEPAPGATPAPGRELTFMEQIIGNVGRFNKGTGEGAGAGDTGGDRQAGPVPNDTNK